MPKGKELYRGGFLNGEEILASLDDIFVPGYVRNPEEQVQQAGIDLTLEKVFIQSWPEWIEMPTVNGDWYFLPPGRSYWIQFNEKVSPYQREFMLILWPRSSLFRSGGALAYGSKQIGHDEVTQGARLLVPNPHGIWLQQGVGVAQAQVLSVGHLFETRHDVTFATSERLTISQIFRYVAPGVLGKSERQVHVAEVEETALDLLPRQGCLVRFAEIIEVAPNEICYSYTDVPYSGYSAMGALADPGYHGQLNACCWAFDGGKLWKGLKYFRVAKSYVTPVGEDRLYAGKYQKTGVEGGEPETIVWHGPGWHPDD